MTRKVAFSSLGLVAAPIAAAAAWAVWAGVGGAAEPASATVSGPAVPCAEAVTGTVCQPARMPAEFAAYRACSDEATRRVLAPEEGVACVEAFLAVKLAFIAGVDRDAYRQMPLEEQIELNLTAYNAYRAWSKSPAARLSDCLAGNDCDV